MCADSLRVSSGVKRGKQVEIEVDGEKVLAYEGESIAAALLASGKRALRMTPKNGTPRGMFCGMGICFDCVMTVDGMPSVRTCVTPVKAGMVVETPQAFGAKEG